MKNPIILISRTDAIGDIVLTLPMAGVIKEYYPDSRVLFLGNSYTKDVILASAHVDDFINYDEWKSLNDQDASQILKRYEIDICIHVFPVKRIADIARKAGIKTRIGTTNRIYHWFTCNKLVKLSRKNSDLHEAQLNIKLLDGIGIRRLFTLNELLEYNNILRIEPLKDVYHNLLSETKFNLILHTKSRGSGQEWSLKNYEDLINHLDLDKIKILITGSVSEGATLANWIQKQRGRVTDATGRFSLSQFIAFIKQADGLVASGTGPLHLAAAAGIHTLGLFPNKKPIYAQRWAPLGKKAEFLEALGEDVNSIPHELVCSKISKWINEE